MPVLLLPAVRYRVYRGKLIHEKYSFFFILTILARGVGEHVFFYCGGSILKGHGVPMALAEMVRYKLLSTEAAVFSLYTCTLRKAVPVLAALARYCTEKKVTDFPVSSRDVT
jgi:hypothetical protein